MQNIILRERKYRDCKMNEGDSVQEHINKHKLLVQDLAVIGSHVPEERQVMELILSLPPSYDSLVNSMQLLQEGLTLKLLISQLLLEEQQRKERYADIGAEAVYSAKVKTGANRYNAGSRKGKKGQVVKKEIQCYKCGEKNDIKKICPKLQHERNNKRKDKACTVGLLAN